VVTTGARGVAPGRYLWYVWSVRDGHRATTAIVRSELTIPGP
jgi:hypothetical protein